METLLHDAEDEIDVYVGRSPIHGDGLFTARNLVPGELIGFYEGPQVKNDGMHVLWVQEDDETWIGYEGINHFRFMNHSDTPNAEMYGRECYSLNNIAVNDEITIDYGWGDT
jgi:SET domain-containing protein